MSFNVPRQVQAKGDDAYTNNELWNGLTAVVGQLNTIPVLNGRMIGPFTLVAGVPLAIAHGLGRAFVGWFPVRLSYPGATSVVQEAPSTLPSSTLRLQCANACTLSLWVF
jgi:hypothetical protein